MTTPVAIGWLLLVGALVAAGVLWAIMAGSADPEPAPATPTMHAVLVKVAGLPTPTIRHEEDGVITLDWDHASAVTLSISIYPDARIGFAALIYGWSAYGTGRNGFPARFDEAIQRYADAVRVEPPHYV